MKSVLPVVENESPYQTLFRGRWGYQPPSAATWFFRDSNTLEPLLEPSLWTSWSYAPEWSDIHQQGVLLFVDGEALSVGSVLGSF